MIVKKVKREQSSKPKAWQIGDLVDYIRSPHTTNAHEKIAHAGSRNFLSGTHSGQRGEMIVLAQESVHSTMPVSHWIFSWKENEQPTRAQVDELVDIFLERMGLTEHQAVYGLHHNTDNYHVHIAVNRMHPYSLKVIRPNNGFDIEAAHKIVALVEHKQGWASEENTRYMVLENSELTRARREQKVQPRPEARDFERATGEKSAQRIAQERGHGIIKNAVSWAELHRELAEKGLRFEKKGSGAIIFVGDVAVKASSVDRAFGMSTLCKRLGEFVPAPEAQIEETQDSVALDARKTHTSPNANVLRPSGQTPPALDPEPVSEVNLEEWREYQTERTKAPQGESQRTETQTRLQSLKIQQREERKRVLFSLAQHGLNILNIAKHFLKLKQKAERRRLRKLGQTASLKQRRGTTPFEAWLRGHGLQEQADRWRYRGRMEKAQTQPRPPIPVPILPPDRTEVQELERYLAAVNADRVRVTCLRMEKDGSRKAFILDKQDGMTKGFTAQELREQMPEMLRLQRRKENIYYTPLSAQRHHILIDDMTRESLRQLQEDGFRPAVLIESSPGNYQCVLTMPKLQSPHDREVGNRLTEHLNKKYGDPQLSGCIHPHRAPGFLNLKPQHQREDGYFPKVLLHYADKKECAQALHLSRGIAQELAAAEAKRQQISLLSPPVPTAPRPNNATAAYHAHFENIQRHLTVEDFSRVDAMIALRLRATGHSPQAVTDAIIQCAPAIRQGRAKHEGRDWHRYAERTTAYAFGVAGDVALAKNEQYVEYWRKIEGIVQEKKLDAPRMRMR